MYDTLRLETDTRGVATLTLAREPKHNAMSAQMIAELTQAAAALAADDAVRVVVLTGAGKSFCAGGDLGWMQAQRDMDPATRSAEAAKLAAMLGALNTLPAASVCDVAIGVDTLKMGFTETRLGIIPATIGPYVLARMGEGRARRVFMSARLFGAAEAVELGLLARAVHADQLDEAIEAEVTPYLSCAPGAVAAAKQLARDLGPRIDTQVVDHTIAALAARWETDEAAEGIGAFFDKRKAAWVSG